MVVDSVGGGPLIGAQVSVEGVNAAAISDSAGRFRIDSVPAGRYRVGVFHPLLDSLGLSVASPPLEVAPGAAVSLIFATPSARTLVRLVCDKVPVDTSEGIGPSAVIGRVLNAETEAPVGRAHVTLGWTAFESDEVAVRRIRHVRQATTGPSGAFTFCHLPADLAGVARATNGASDSSLAVRPYGTGGRFLSLLVMHVSGQGASAKRGQAGALSGVLTGTVVRSDSGGPFAGAEVLVSGSTDTAVTNDSGHFSLRGLPTGTRTLRVRALGWQPVLIPIELSQREARHIVVPLAIKTAVLQTVVVTATLKSALERVGFEDRKRMNVGHFLTPDDIAKKSASELVDLVAGMPGVVRRAGPNGEDYLAGTRGSGCVHYIVDGTPFEEMTPGEINSVVPPDQVGAIELYQQSETPPQYNYGASTIIVAVPSGAVPGRAGSMISAGGGARVGPGPVAQRSSCVRIVIWTKARLAVTQ